MGSEGASPPLALFFVLLQCSFATLRVKSRLDLFSKIRKAPHVLCRATLNVGENGRGILPRAFQRINRCKSNCYFVVAGVVSSYGEENKEEAG